MADKKEERVEIRLPLLEDPNAPQTEYYALNFVGYTIQRGVPVMVPKALAEIIEHAEEERPRALVYAREMALKEPQQSFLQLR